MASFLLLSSTSLAHLNLNNLNVHQPLNMLNYFMRRLYNNDITTTAAAWLPDYRDVVLLLITLKYNASVSCINVKPNSIDSKVCVHNSSHSQTHEQTL